MAENETSRRTNSSCTISSPPLARRRRRSGWVVARVGGGGRPQDGAPRGSRPATTLRPGFEGGQTPLSMRLPKLPGFTNPNKEEFAIVNLAALDVFDKGGE